MEKEQEPKIFINLEVQEGIRLSLDEIKKTEELISEGLDLLKEDMELFNNDIAYLEHMESHNEFISDYKEETGRDSGLNIYSEEAILKVKNDIEKMRIGFEKINASIAELILSKVELSMYKQKFEELNNEFKNNLLRIDSLKLN